MLPSLIDPKRLELDELLNEWKTKFEVPEKTRASFYPGFSYALTEAIRGMQNLFPHKKKVYLLGNAHPLMEEAYQYLSGEAFDIKMIPWKDLASQEEEILKEDFNFVLYCEDHFLTGEIFPWKEFSEKLEAKRKYSISLSSSSHLSQAEEYQKKNSFHIRILGVGRRSAIGLYGSRLRKLSALGIGKDAVDLQSFEDFKNFSVENVLSESDLKSAEKAFDSIDGVESYFSGQSRYRDRFVLRIPGVDTFAIKQMYLRESKSLEGKIITASLCEWGGIKELSWFNEDFPSYEMIVLSAKEFKDKQQDFSEKLEKIKSLMGLS